MIVAGKTCKCCERLLPALAFAYKGSEADQLQPWCRECNAANSREWRRTHKDKPRDLVRVRAQRLVQAAVAAGLIHKPTHCEHCHVEAPLEGHHPNYDQPLNVTWLCRDCHQAEHRNPATVAPALKLAA